LDSKFNFPEDFGFDVNLGNSLTPLFNKGDFGSALGEVLKMTDSPKSFDFRTSLVSRSPDQSPNSDIYQVTLLCISDVLAEVLVAASREQDARNTGAMLFLTIAFPSVFLGG
jgi:hypothetical protein